MASRSRNCNGAAGERHGDHANGCDHRDGDSAAPVKRALGYPDESPEAKPRRQDMIKFMD